MTFPVLHKVYNRPHQPIPWSHLLRQHRPGLGGDIPGHLPGGLDGRDVFCSGRSLFLELDILRLSHSGEIFQSSVTLDLTHSKYFLGWVILHDQLMSGRHCHPVLRDQEERDGQDEGRESQVHLVLHPVLLHQQVGAQC